MSASWMRQYSQRPAARSRTWRRSRSGMDVAMTLRGLLPQLALCFQLDKLHQMLDDRIALQFPPFVFREHAITVAMDERIGSCSDVRGRVEGDDLLRRRMMGKKPCDFSGGLCLEQHQRGPFLTMTRS